MKNYKSLTDAMDDLRRRGYEADFASQTICLYCGDLDIRLDPEDFHVDEAYQFKDAPTPGDNAALYAISSSTGVKGTLVDTHANYSLKMNLALAKKLEDQPAMAPY